MSVQQMMPMDIQGTAETVASNRKQIKHIGKLKDSNANVAIIFRTVPSDHKHALVIGPKFLDNNYHDAFMKALESNEGQNSFELGTHLSKSRFNDGVEMLPYLHQNNLIKKVPTDNVIVTMGAGTQGQVQLDELNKLIAKEKGITLEALSNLDSDEKPAVQTTDATTTESDATKKTTKKSKK
jgi:hypothetical protein